MSAIDLIKRVPYPSLAKHCLKNMRSRYHVIPYGRQDMTDDTDKVHKADTKFVLSFRLHKEQGKATVDSIVSS